MKPKEFRLVLETRGWGFFSGRNRVLGRCEDEGRGGVGFEGRGGGRGEGEGQRERERERKWGERVRLDICR